MKKIALISVSDKTGIEVLARELSLLNYTIAATGNTANLISKSGIEVTEVSHLTGFPEVFDGRVKTLHPKIFGGILYRRRNGADVAEVEKQNIPTIEIVVVNLYPFIITVQKPNVAQEEIIENIDIGGPSLIRASAKNYNDVCVLTDPSQYEAFLTELKSGKVSIETKKKLAVAAFSYTAFYDSYISNYLEKEFDIEATHIRINQPVEKKLRYGENPHQSAFLFGEFQNYFEVFHGKEISYNNILDLVSGVELVEDLGNNSSAIIKHNNPAGAAIGSDPFDAYTKALKCDPVSAFGGIVVFQDTVDANLAETLNEIFLEIICAPSYTEDALNILKKKKDRRLLKQLKKLDNESLSFRNIPGGVIVQDADKIKLDVKAISISTDKRPTEDELNDLLFAWKVAKHTKSNAIVFAKDRTTLGVGAGQMSRIDSAKIAFMKAEEHGLNLNGSVAASDAFFPFADGLLEIIKCGVTAVIQPGGSVRDGEVIEAANKNNISMVFTGVRHFKH